jgi:hypothetical protein
MSKPRFLILKCVNFILSDITAPLPSLSDLGSRYRSDTDSPRFDLPWFGRHGTFAGQYVSEKLD